MGYMVVVVVVVVVVVFVSRQMRGFAKVSICEEVCGPSSVVSP